MLGHNYFQSYLIRGSCACALVEAGIPATADLLLEQLSLIGARPRLLIVTHPHSDHVTGLDRLKKAFPLAAVIAGKGAESFLRHPRAADVMAREDRYMAGFMASKGIFSGGTQGEVPFLLSGCRVANDGDEMDLGGLKIRFLEAKGHSPGNILVHVPDDKTLLASDSLGNLYPGRGFFPTFFTGYSDYQATIDSLAALDPGIVGLAHNGLFTGGGEIKRIFRDARKAARDLKTYVMNDTRDNEAIARDIFHFYYCDELTMCSRENIFQCCRILVRRIREL